MIQFPIHILFDINRKFEELKLKIKKMIYKLPKHNE